MIEYFIKKIKDNKWNIIFTGTLFVIVIVILVIIPATREVLRNILIVIGSVFTILVSGFGAKTITDYNHEKILGFEKEKDEITKKNFSDDLDDLVDRVNERTKKR